MVDVAFNAGADAIKFQTYITDDIILSNTPKAEYQLNSTNSEENFYEMLKKYELSKQDFEILDKYCQKKGIIFLSTPFDFNSVDILENLNIPAYKISSGDLDNFPLLKYICYKKKPILLSTGMATLKEVEVSVKYIKSNGVNDLVILQCTSNYPTLYSELNLNVIDTYKKFFPEDIIGFSDHSIDFIASIGAVAKGAKVIEKHFTLDKNMIGPDHKASLNPDELNNWIKSIRIIDSALGSYEKIPSNVELEIAKVAKKSIVTIKALKKGDFLKEGDIFLKRPGLGIAPKYYEAIIGKKIKKDIPKDSIIKWDDLE